MNTNFYDNSIFANNLKRRLEEKDISGAELARRLNVSKAAVSDWLKGKSLPRVDKIDKICIILNCTREDFATQVPKNAIPITGFIEIAGRIAAGAPILAQETIIDRIPTILKNPDEYFGLLVQGDSMINANIPDGAYAIIHKQPCAENGDIVACLVNGEDATLKRYREQGDSIILMPENSNYNPILVSKKDFKDGKAQILGVLREVTIRY